MAKMIEDFMEEELELSLGIKAKNSQSNPVKKLSKEISGDRLSTEIL